MGLLYQNLGCPHEHFMYHRIAIEKNFMVPINWTDTKACRAPFSLKYFSMGTVSPFKDNLIFTYSFKHNPLLNEIEIYPERVIYFEIWCPKLYFTFKFYKT